jgi:STE24 endopeptidase
VLAIIIIILLFDFLFESILDYLNIRNWSPEIPAVVKDKYDVEKYSKARQYALVNYKFGMISGGFSLLVLLIALLSGFFGWLDTIMRNYTSSPVFIAIIFFGAIGLISDLLTTPFKLYRTFVIEEKFGFNKMTIKTFVTDKLKGYVLSIVLGGLVIGLLVKIFELTGDNFWWLAWFFMTILMLLITVFYASWIVPIFNKLTPLPAGDLREAINVYSRQNNFPLNDIYVMDGSKRSSKANAFFSGLGRKKKIVLFDTLIKEHSTEELVAVLAHETGHFKLKHTLTGFIAGIAQTGTMLFVFSLLQNNPSLYTALGATQPGLHLSLLAFGLLYTPVSILTGILMHSLSRKNEFEADDFAKKTSSGSALVSALKKLSADNLSNLTPHPAYVFVHYSHPPLVERLRALEV